MAPSEINTGGGYVVSGNVGTGGGDFVGRDSHQVVITQDDLTDLKVEMKLVVREVHQLQAQLANLLQLSKDVNTLKVIVAFVSVSVAFLFSRAFGEKR
jgi:hypothetical protein